MANETEAYLAAYEQTRQQINMLEEQAHRVVWFFPVGLAGLGAYGFEKNWPDPILYACLALMLFSCLYVLSRKESIFRLAGYLAECVEPQLPHGARYERLLDNYRVKRDASTLWGSALSATGQELFLIMGISLALFGYGFYQQHWPNVFEAQPFVTSVVCVAVVFGFVFLRWSSIRRLRRRDAPHREAWRIAVVKEAGEFGDE